MHRLNVILLALLFATAQLSFGQRNVNILYSVYFQPETSILMEDSKYQLQELFSMLQDSAAIRIKLHGHTNGNPSGTYTRLGENDTVFFKMTGHHEKTTGSAKKLSHDRALTVKRYLVWKGIAADRIEVKGWGGKIQIHAENSRFAQKNRRVEVEILEE